MRFYISNLNMQISAPNIFLFIKHSENVRALTVAPLILQQVQTFLDDANSTVLHTCANYNNYDMANYFITEHKNLMAKYPNRYTPQSKKKWIQFKDNEGFTCLHYAVFRGNYKIAKLFQQNGADIFQINSQGLTVLHIAAQGDSPLLIYYFLTKGINIETLDSKGNTALHWACYSGMQNSAFALISWGASIDVQQQKFGMTPLHLAVLSGNSRVVKKLLLKGCSRAIQNKNGKLPLEIAKQNKFTNIQEMIMDKRGIGQLCNMKTSFRKVSKYSYSFFLFITIFLTTYVFNIVSYVLMVTNQQDMKLQRIGMEVAYLVVGFIEAVLFITTCLSNPGNLSNSYDKNRIMMQLLLRNNSKKLCFECGIAKPQRSRHCQVCQACVSVYDHHCPWVANCIGSHNYCVFYSFLISSLTFMIMIIILEVTNITELSSIEPMSTIIIISLTSSVYNLALAAIFIIPLIMLIVTQTRNMIENKTTFERYTNKYSKPDNRNSYTQTSYTKRSELLQDLKQMSPMTHRDSHRDTQRDTHRDTQRDTHRDTLRESKSQAVSMSVERNSYQNSTNPMLNEDYGKNCMNVCWGNKKIIRYNTTV